MEYVYHVKKIMKFNVTVYQKKKQLIVLKIHIHVEEYAQKFQIVEIINVKKNVIQNVIHVN